MDNFAQEKKWLLEEKYDRVESEEFQYDFEQLKKGVPLAYLIGHVPFLGATMYLDSRPLIPRPETEFWVEKIIEEMPKDKNLNVLDLCAGSGCIGVAVLMHRPESRVDFVEIDTSHHATIQKNCIKNHIPINRYMILGGDLFENVSEKYDYIFSNPPYIDAAANTVEKNVEKHEPHQALFGGKDGTELIEQIVTEVPQYLKENGVLVIEHESTHAEYIQNLGKKYFGDTQTKKDQFGLLRYTILKKK